MVFSRHWVAEEAGPPYQTRRRRRERYAPVPAGAVCCGRVPSGLSMTPPSGRRRRGNLPGYPPPTRGLWPPKAPAGSCTWTWTRSTHLGATVDGWGSSECGWRPFLGPERRPRGPARSARRQTVTNRGGRFRGGHPRRFRGRYLGFGRVERRGYVEARLAIAGLGRLDLAIIT